MNPLIHDSLTRFIAQVVAIIVVSRLVALGTRRLGQPLVVAEMIGGILLGPSLLGWLAPDVFDVLFAHESLRSLHLVSQFGLVFFMFLVGIELNPAHFRGSNTTSIAVSQIGIIVPFVLGSVLALWMYPRFSTEATSRTAFILFTGAAMSITAFPVLARILTEQRLLGTRIGAITIGCAAINDVTAWCLLAFIVAVARHHDPSSTAIGVVLTFGFILLMIIVVRPILARIAARWQDPSDLPEYAIVGVVIVVLVSSWMTELIGIHALFGGFMAGAIMPREHGFAHALSRRLESLVVVVLLPLFFASSGLNTQIGLLSSGYEWIVCAVIILVACAGKFGGCALAARATGFDWRQASAIGVLMNTRGLVELIVLNIGLELGVISPVVFSMMVLMALVTTFAATPLLRWIHRPA